MGQKRNLIGQQELRDYLMRLPSLLEDMNKLSAEGSAYVAEVLGEYEEELWRRAMVYEHTEEDQMWRDAVVAEYTRLTLNPETVSSARHDLLNEAIRDSIDIPRMRRNYGRDLGI